ncbi:MAG: bacteriophage holin [Planctomycetota bacterium]
MKLNIKAFALSCGLIWGFGLFFMAWWLIMLEDGNPESCLLNRMYPGYTMTPVGSLIGAAWGFFDAGIGGLVFAWLYNLFADKFNKTA